MAAGEETLPATGGSDLLQGLGGGASGSASPAAGLGENINTTLNMTSTSTATSTAEANQANKTVTDASYKHIVNFGDSGTSALSKTATVALAVAIPGGLVLLLAVWWWFHRKGS